MINTELPTFECRCGLTTREDGACGIFIVSPRTGYVAVVYAERFPEIPDRLPGRIAQAKSRGESAVRLMRQELVAVRNADARLSDAAQMGLRNTPGGSRFSQRRFH